MIEQGVHRIDRYTQTPRPEHLDMMLCEIDILLLRVTDEETRRALEAVLQLLRRTLTPLCATP